MLAICPGSFDPVTHGHLDVIARAAALFDEVIVAVGRNSAKNYLFTLEERLDLVREATARPGRTSASRPLDGLLVDFAARTGRGVLVKGLRFASDFDFELQMAHMNAVVGSVETVMLPASLAMGHAVLDDDPRGRQPTVATSPPSCPDVVAPADPPEVARKGAR